MPDRAKRWYAQIIASSGIAAGTGVTADFTAGVDAAYLDCTLVRIRGMMRVRYDSGAALYGAYSAGFVVVSQDAAGVGGTAVPDPFTDRSADWMWHHSGLVRNIANDATAEDQVLIDNRSMRIMHQANKTLVFAFENHGTDVLSFAINASVLLMLK